MEKFNTKMELKQKFVNLHCDSQNELHITANQLINNRMKHININYHSIKHVVYDKSIELIKIDGKSNQSHVLIKIIPLERFRRHCVTMQVWA